MDILNLRFVEPERVDKPDDFTDASCDCEFALEGAFAEKTVEHRFLLVLIVVPVAGVFNFVNSSFLSSRFLLR